MLFANPSHLNGFLSSPSLDVVRALGASSGPLRPILECHATHYWKIRNNMLRDMEVGGVMRNEPIAQQYATLARQLDAEMERFARVIASHCTDSPRKRSAGRNFEEMSRYSWKVGTTESISKYPNEHKARAREAEHVSRRISQTTRNTKKDIPDNLTMASGAARKSSNAEVLPPQVAIGLTRFLSAIDKILRNVQKLGEHINNFSTIHSLPGTILEMIFCYTTDEFAGSARNLRLCHVCRIWRAVALQCGRLWSDIVANHSATNWTIVKTLLSRSMTASLDIRSERPMNIPASPTVTDDEDTILLGPPDVLHLILKEMHRIRSLRLAVSHETYGELMKSLAGPAPRLEVLALSLSGTHSQAAGSFSSAEFYFPALRVLQSQGLQAHLAWPLIFGGSSTITHLKLRIPHRSLGRELNADTILATIQSMPRLTTLDLGSHVLPFPLTPKAHISRRVVDCHTLRTLRLSGEISHLNWFLDHLQLRSSVYLDLAIFAHSTILQDEYTAFSHHLSRHLGFSSRTGDRLPPLDHAACFWQPSSGLRGRSPSTLHIMLSDHDDAIRDYFDTDGPNVLQNGGFESWEEIETAFDLSRTTMPRRPGQRTLSIWMLDTVADRMRNERVEAIWSTFPLQKVHTLFLDGVPIDIPEGVPFWQRVLRVFMNYIFPMLSTKRLIARDWDPSWLGELIAPRWFNYQDVVWTTALPLPDLKSLTLSRREEMPRGRFKRCFHEDLCGVFYERRERSTQSKTRLFQELVLDNYVDRQGALGLEEWIPRCVRNGEVLWSR